MSVFRLVSYSLLDSLAGVIARVRVGTLADQVLAQRVAVAVYSIIGGIAKITV